MAAHPFASFNPKPSHWGYNWISEIEKPSVPEPVKPPPTQTQNCQSSSPEPQMMATQYANMPAALLNTLKREKKPFTYTPGGVNLSEVLNARLQKRMERKKKYSQEKMAVAEDEFPKYDTPKQVIVMPTYNTPLDMYSMENALEALEVQAGLVANEKSLSAAARSATLPRNHTFRFDDKDMDPGQKVAQSKAFKVLQIITDTEEENPIGKQEHFRDEMRFTGFRESKAIPSKFFHTLQKITGTEEEEEQESLPKEMQQVGPSRSASFKTPTPAARPPFMPQQNLPQFRNDNRVAPQPTQQPQFNNNTALKRPAAFLPIKTTPGAGFRPVQPPFLSNGPMRRVGNTSAGTDF